MQSFFKKSTMIIAGSVAILLVVGGFVWWKHRLSSSDIKVSDQEVIVPQIENTESFFTPEQLQAQFDASVNSLIQELSDKEFATSEEVAAYAESKLFVIRIPRRDVQQEYMDIVIAVTRMREQPTEGSTPKDTAANIISLLRNLLT